MTVSQAPAIVATGQGEPWWFGGSLFDIKVSSPDLFLFEVSSAGGKATPLHSHPEDETFYVLEGELRIHVDGAEHLAGPGTTVFAPRDVPHAFLVSSEHARFLNIMSPGSAEAFYRAGGEAAPGHVLPPPGPLPIERIKAAAEQTGHRILGPPPF